MRENVENLIEIVVLFGILGGGVPAAIIGAITGFLSETGVANGYTMLCFSPEVTWKIVIGGTSGMCAALFVSLVDEATTGEGETAMVLGAIFGGIIGYFIIQGFGVVSGAISGAIIGITIGIIWGVMSKY
ncbi:MAG: hypothetical protein KAT65_00460 [Methanophagales archaeon]|nr:hypothetical protein [Methanophagales archaeon]